MERATIRAEGSVLRRARQFAREEGTTLSSVVTEALEQFLATRLPERPRKGFPYEGLGDSGLGDASERIDELFAEGMEEDRKSWRGDPS